MSQLMSQPNSLLDPEVAINPYPFYKKLRTETPVFWDEKMQCWAISRYADVVALGHDPRLSGIPPKQPDWDSRQEVLKLLTHNLVLFNDPPSHTRLRKLMEQGFLPRIARTGDRIEQVVNNLIDAVIDKGRLDIVRDFAVPLPLTVQSEFIGLPAEDSLKLTQWQTGLAVFVFMTGFVTQLDTQTAAQEYYQSLLSLCDYLSPLIEVRRRQPQDDLITDLLQLEAEGDRLNEPELLMSSLIFMTGSFLSITVALTNCILGLLRNPDQLVLLQENPSSIESAVEELLRYESQVQFLCRRAREDFELHGQLIRQDQTVIVGLGSSNRDDTQFADPDRLDITRSDNRHIAFGYGPHGCIAAPLARLHIRIAINTLLKRLQGLRLETEDVVWNGAPMFRATESLGVTFSSYS
jgi:cytochrome P450